MRLARAKRHTVASIGLVVLLVAPWALAQGSFFRVSPGPLSESHAEHDNSEGCPKCHEANTGVTNAKCLDCHKTLRKRIAKKSGLHATFTGKCIQCHPGHKGRTVSIIDWKHVGGQQTFKHEQTGFALTEHHAQVACTACHTRRLKSGRISYLGLDRECVTCHKDVHKFTQQDLIRQCDLCHAAGKVNRGMKLADWETQHLERTKLALPGKHREQPCIECHRKAEMPARAKPRTCIDCHRPSHPTPAPLARCAECHKEAQPWKKATIDHRRFGFALLGKHTTLGCRRCHQRGAKVEYSPGACASCHQHRDAHKGQFADKPCDSCHVEGGKRTRPFDHNADTRFRLEGFHARPRVRNKCISCHPQKIYRTEKLGCADCHKDKHKGQSGPNCTECHSVTQRWKDARYNRKHQKFPLEGLHRQVKCEKCHPKSKYKFGQGEVHCVDCHGKTDPHKGKLGTACEKCHVPEKGAPKFNHDEMTKFTRTGAHKLVECGYCHRQAQPAPPQIGWTSQEPAGKLDRTFPLMGKRCADCHADPHKGAAGLECQQCHGTTSFRMLLPAARTRRPSDHDRGFLGKHVQLPFDDNDLMAEGRACTRCHGTCDRCHRTMRPKSHTALWRLRGHGTAAAFDSESCRVCHVTGTCIQCHRSTAPLNHRGSWGTIHGYAAGTFAGNNCYVCHSRADCYACHPPK